MKRPVWTRAIIIHHGHIQRLPRRCSASRSRRRLVGHPEGTAVGIPFRIGATRNHPQGTCCIPCVPRTRPFCDSLEQAQTREQRQRPLLQLALTRLTSGKLANSKEIGGGPACIAASKHAQIAANRNLMAIPEKVTRSRLSQVRRKY